jgi:phosphoribosyl-AMP cyclohydrolase/phosphoribosyl-ATP pyrophosphohydrolase/phosphoribosyl-AMP cyclohydrolase
VINQKYLWLDILKFNDRGLIPAIAQDFQDHRVLELIWLDKNSLRKVIDEGIFKPKYTVRSIFYDCDADALLLKVEQSDCKSKKL